MREESNSIDSGEDNAEEVSAPAPPGHRAPTLLYVTRDGLKRSRKDLYKSTRRQLPRHFPGVAHDTAIKSGHQVDTPFGPGIVLRFRAHDAIYELRLLGFPARAYMDARSVQLVGPSTSTSSFSLTTRFASIMSRLTVSRAGSTSLEAGQNVDTRFGRGAVVCVRADMIVEVDLEGWRGVLFVHMSQVTAEVSTEVDTGSIVKKESTLVSLLKKLTSSTSKAKRRDVATAFGKGQLLEVREGDGMKIIELDWGGKLYTSAEPEGVVAEVEPRSSSLSGRLRSLISMPTFGMSGKSLKAVSPKYSDLLGAIGDEIPTPFGTGIIIGWRNAYVVVVQLSFGIAYIPITEVQGQEKEERDMGVDASAGGYFTDEDGMTSDTKEKSGVGRPRSLSESYETIKYLTTTKLFGLFFPDRGIFKKGDQVSTPMGAAEVVRFRRKDRLYELAMLDFQAVAYCHQDQVNVRQVPDEKQSQEAAEQPKIEGRLPDVGIIPLGHTEFSWEGEGEIPISHTAFSWRGSL